MSITSVNPYTDEVNAEFESLSIEQCKEAVGRARRAFTRWKVLPVSERAEYLRKVADALRKNNRRYGEIITREMGKPIVQAIGEVDKCAWLCDFYGRNGANLLQDEIVATDVSKSYVTFEPLGIVLGIMPWNFPFWQVLRFAIPTMVAGNVCLLKHASNVPITALEIERIFLDAGFPEGVFQTLLISGRLAGGLIEQDLVDAVSLTGSVAAGSQVGAVAGKHIKKLVLELGGSDPFIVLDDADIDKAAETAIFARNQNTGQSCIAAKRFIVMESVAEGFCRRFLERFKAMKIGDPMDEKTDIGPLAGKEFAKTLEIQLEDARGKGAEVIYGPNPPEGKGAFFRPAVVTNVKPGMKIFDEEVFGPIAPIVTAKNEEDIVGIANATEFGLGASIWSGNTQRAEQLAKRIEAGFVAINDMVKSDPRLPFGGIKKSGVGRELSYYGMKEFVNVKTVVVK